jgi:ribose/xylose/arabinose/galactoside ABC-type transport system permease subunit
MRARWSLRSLIESGVVNLLILAALVVVVSMLSDRLYQPGNVANVLRQISIVAIVGSAVTLVMVSGGLDLSIGGVLALSGVVAAIIAADGYPIELAFLIGVLAGATIGLLNGVLVVWLRINAVIATLGTLFISRGIANLVTDGVPVHEVPQGYNALGVGFLGPVPYPVVVMAVVVVIFTVIGRFSMLGRHAIAIGSNQEAARLSGIAVDRTRITLYVLVGLTAGLGGVIVSSRLNSGQPTVGTGFEFEVIVAAVLGGTSLAGGVGSVPKTLVGALIIGVLANAMNILGVGIFWQPVVQGAVLVVAVAVDMALREGGHGWSRPSWLRTGLRGSG